MQTQADWYRDECEGVTSPRIPNYNYTAPGFHELVARQPPLTHDDEILIDDLARRRCQCLMSVDDAHAAIVEATKALGVFEKTYFIISSDHVRTLCACVRGPAGLWLTRSSRCLLPGLQSWASPNSIQQVPTVRSRDANSGCDFMAPASCPANTL